MGCTADVGFRSRQHRFDVLSVSVFRDDLCDWCQVDQGLPGTPDRKPSSDTTEAQDEKSQESYTQPDRYHVTVQKCHVECYCMSLV